MNRGLLLCSLLFLLAFGAQAQMKTSAKMRDSAFLDSSRTKRTDTLKPKYVNLGKIAARRAAISSALLPGLGQIRNGVTVYRLAKVAGIYTGITLLTLSYMSNDKSYKIYLDELQFRSKNKGVSPLGSIYTTFPQEGLIAAKDIARRNREVVIFSLGGLYLMNIVEAYVDARLKYFDVGDVAFKVSPGIINGGSLYGNNSIAPGLKITLSL
ncbi:hypothetical protein ACVWYN_003402 [Pedobacter sp. UYP24]